jgi:hypothetical protein
MMTRDPHEAAERREAYRKDQAGETLLAALNEALARIPLPAPPADADVARLPIVYIIGAPRSGTTLLSQLTSRFLPLGYIDNLMARFWSRPSVGIRLSRAVLGPKSREGIVFHSTHGVSEGVHGPHEFGYFWRRWLPLDGSPTHHLSGADLKKADRDGLRQALEREILASFGTGVVFKNVICGFHAAFLTALHPVSLFVHITRDPFETAASILESRKERYGSYDAWWSLKPSTYPFDVGPGDPAAGVVRQVLDCRAEMQQELAQPGVQGLTVAYEDLCADAGGVLKAICRRLEAMGCPVQPLGTEFPAFAQSRTPRLPEPLTARLRTCLQEFHHASQTS